MIEFFEFISNSPFQAVLTILFFVAAVKGLYEFIAWIKKELDKWYTNRNTKEQIKIDIEERIDTLENENRSQYEKLTSMEESIIQINDKLDIMAENIRHNTVSQARTSLYRLYTEFENRDSITSSEYEMFTDLSVVYLKAGGNSTFKNKIIPFVESLPIKD